MDTLKDKQVLEDLVDKGTMPSRLDGASRAASSGEEDWMKHLRLAGPGERLSVLCIGAHSDDIDNRHRRDNLGLDRSWPLGQLLKAWMTPPKVRELIQNRVTPI